MSFREKSYVIILLGMLAFALVYYGALATGVSHGTDAVALFITALLVQIVISAVGTGVIAILDPKNAGRPPDERERLVEWRANRIAYVTMLSGALGAASLIHFGFSAFGLANAIFGAVLLAEIVHYGAFLLLMRRPA